MCITESYFLQPIPQSLCRIDRKCHTLTHQLSEVRLGVLARENTFHRIIACLLETLSYLNVYINAVNNREIIHIPQ